jgi:hypothetical protein
MPNEGSQYLPLTGGGLESTGFSEAIRYLVKSGTVEATQSFADSKEPIVASFAPGYYFGYAGLMSSTRNIVTACGNRERGRKDPAHRFLDDVRRFPN